MNEKRFYQLWKHVVGPHSATSPETVWQEIAYHYSQQDRFYHTAQHITFCLKQLDNTIPLLNAPKLVEMALWFHDIIYIMNSDSNEQDSAVFFASLAGEAPQCQSMVSRVQRLIIDTTHASPPSSSDGEYLVDIDLSSLGRPWDEFIEDSKNVRRESPHLNDVDYHRGQKIFFERLLAKPQIFYTKLFSSRFETQARANLQKLLIESGNCIQ